MDVFQKHHPVSPTLLQDLTMLLRERFVQLFCQQQHPTMAVFMSTTPLHVLIKHAIMFIQPHLLRRAVKNGFLVADMLEQHAKMQSLAMQSLP